MTTHLKRMFRSMAWADRQVLGSIGEHPQSSGEALRLLGHILAAEHIWLARLEEREAQFPVWPQFTLDQCQQIAAENEAGFRQLLDRQHPDDLERMIVYRNTKGEFATRAIDILTHVVIHGAYHRGQIAKCLGQNGAAAPNTDYITFAREIEPL